MARVSRELPSPSNQPSQNQAIDLSEVSLLTKWNLLLYSHQKILKPCFCCDVGMILSGERISHQFALQRVDLLHHSGVEFDGVGDISQDLFVGMGRFLVQQDPHGFAGLHSAPHHCHELRTYEVLDLAALGGPSLGAAQGRRPTRGCRRGLDVYRPVGVDVFSVIQLFVGFDGAAHVALACWGFKGMKRGVTDRNIWRSEINSRKTRGKRDRKEVSSIGRIFSGQRYQYPNGTIARPKAHPMSLLRE